MKKTTGRNLWAEAFRFVRVSRLLLLLLLVLVLTIALPACRTAAPRAEQKRYELRGKIVSLDRSRRTVTVAHREIPDLMEAMTMPFTIRAEWAFEVMAPQDEISATLVVEGEKSWLEEPVITKPRERAANSANEAPAPAVHEPPDEVPPFELLNQDNRLINTAEYRGRALLLTFIYTRCPLPDYCILMSNNFADINAQLKREPGLLREKTRLLSISIDPARDTPRALRDYGLVYLKNEAADFKYWDFATGTPEQIRAVADFFGLSYTPDGEQIAHTLTTVLIAPDGKMAHVYRGNDWTVKEVMGDLEKVIKDSRAR